MRRTGKNLLVYGAALCGAAQFIYMPGAVAQTTGVETITVTAERRDENIQKTPVAVSAFSSQDLQDRQLHDTKAITTQVPNVWYGTAFSDPTDMELGVRGITSPGANVTADPAVPVYIDGVYIARTSGTNVGLVDESSVQVLRGPQGTLFGRNSTGGAFVITTNDPTDEFGGSISARVGTYQLEDVTGIINVPFSDDVQGRLVYEHLSHEGYNKSDITGQRLDGVRSQDYLRGKLKFELGANWTLNLAGEYLHSDGPGTEFKLGYLSPTSKFNAVLPALSGNPGDLLTNYLGGDYHHNQAQNRYDFDIRLYTGTATITGKIGDVTVKSITSYRNLKENAPVDLDGTPYTLLEVAAQPLAMSQTTQEFQALGDGLDGKLTWIAGAYYFQESGFERDDSLILGPLLHEDNLTFFNLQNISESLYGQVTYQLLDKLSIYAGVRYNKDIRHINYHDGAIDTISGVQTCTLNSSIRKGTGCDAPGRIDANYIPFTAGVNYQMTEDDLLYAKVSEGYRSGAFPQSTVSNLPFLNSVSPEKVLSPEVGVKTQWFDNTLRLNLAAFYEDYTNLQQQLEAVSPSGFPVLVQANVGDAKILGAEAEAEVQLDNLNLHGSFGIQNPHYTAGPFVHTPFLYASKMTASLGATLPVETSIGIVTFNADYSWRSSSVFAYIKGNDAANASLRQGGYGLANAQISYDFQNVPLTVSIWGQNLFDQDYKTRALSFVSGVGQTVFSVGDPRTLGLSASYKF